MSSRSLSIGVTFLTGRYHGEEWPPSSARLYQAMVAGVMTCGYREHAAEVEPALRWLERQLPPQIRACDAQKRSSYRIAVPNNDMDVIALDWVCGRAADPATLRTMKNVQPRQVPGDGPHVQYVWKVDAGEADAMMERLRIAAHCLYTLGWGVDMVFADVREPEESAAVYEPGASGERWAVPMEGTLDDLFATYRRFQNRASGKDVDTHTRPSLLRMQPYRRAGEIPRAVARFRLMQPDGDGTVAVAWENCMRVAGWLRGAAAKRLANEFEADVIEEYIQGHTKAGEEGRRLSYVPVPTIYKGYADGAIRRAMVVDAGGAGEEVIRILRRKMNGCVLLDKDKKEACCLAPIDAEDWTFEQYLPARPATVWRSVTPVVLHGFNTDGRGRISVSKTERLLLRAFEMAGYGERLIDGFAFQTGPLWPSTKHSAAMRVPDHLDGYPRIHVEARFREGVQGPVLAGLGRHYGIGLFARAKE